MPDDEVPIDELISASMMQRAVGNPNAPAPPVRAGNVLRSKKSASKPKNMIQEVYRQQAKLPKKPKYKSNA